MDELPVSPLQAMFDGFGAAWKKRRAETQMTLGELIETLEGLDPTRKIAGLGDPMSYRGYYCDLAFDPTNDVITIAEALAKAKACMGQVFEGYKGGDFTMGADTPIWSASYGDSGCPRIMGLKLETDPIRLELKYEGEEA